MRWNKQFESYWSEDGRWKLHKGYPSFNSSICWILENIKTHEAFYFGTMKESKMFAESYNEQNA